MKIIQKIKVKITKSKLTYKNEQNKKNGQNAKIEVLAAIPPLNITSSEAIRHFDGDCGGFAKTPDIDILDDSKRKNFKNERQETQLKMLYIYTTKMSKDRIYKKESNRIIAEYFYTSKDTIQRRFNQLVEGGHLVELKQMNRFYRIVKEL